MKLWLKSNNITEEDGWGKKHKVIFYDDPAWIKVSAKINLLNLSHYQKKSVSGQDLTIDWLFEESQNLSLFSEKKIWNVLNADKIPITQQNKILNQKDIFQKSQDIILWFWVPHGSKNTFWKKLDIEILEIDKLPFWEEKQCIQWLMHIYQVNVKEAQPYWPWDSELSLSQHVQLLEMVSNRLISLNEVVNFFEQTSFERDKFLLLEKFEPKSLATFFTELRNYLERDDYAGQLITIQFIRSMVFKLLKMKDDPQFTSKSSFDKKLHSSSKLWVKKDLLKYLKLFLDWEMKLKAQSDIQYEWALEVLPKLTK